MLDEFRSTNITWDKATSRIYSPVTANESDENGRKLVVQIVNGGQVEDLTGATLHLYWETRDKAHDGLDVFKAVNLKKGEFELSYTTGMLSNKGVLNANLVLIYTVGRVVSERFKITVTEGIDNGAIQSENSFSSLTQALIDISNLEQNYAPRLNNLTAQLQQNEERLDDISLDIRQFGFIGDGVNDDAVSIQNAIDHATSLIQPKFGDVDMFAGQVIIQLPPKKIYIKSKITVSNAITIQGHGTATTLILMNDLDYIFNFDKTNSITRNEESQIAGGSISNFRISGNKRRHTLTSAVRLFGVDNFIVDTVYFYAIKGKCIELKGCRESNFNNIFTRFCGTTTVGNIEIVSNAPRDTSNLNMGTNWSVVFPYGPALKIVDGNFTNINGFLVHGIFEPIKNSLISHFGVDDYDYQGSSQIEMTRGEIKITGGDMVYAPNKNSYIKLNDNSTCHVSNTKIRGHYKPIETHGSGDYFFYLSGTSTLFISGGVIAQSAAQSTDIFYNDGTSFIYGSLENIHSAQWYNTSVVKNVSASEIRLLSDRTSPVTIRPRATQSAKTVSGLGRIMYEIMTATDGVDAPILQLGVNTHITKALAAIPDGALFKLPANNAADVPMVNGLIFIDGSNLKIVINGVVKTITIT